MSSDDNFSVVYLTFRIPIITNKWSTQEVIVVSLVKTYYYVLNLTLRFRGMPLK